MGVVALLAAATGATSMGGIAPGTPARAAGAERPNVLLVITDDQREGKAVMPALRRHLLRKGVSFTNTFATTPSCCPSRASIFTGRYSHNHGVTDNSSAAALDVDSTVQAYLEANGYRTGLVGKYLNKWTTIGSQDPSHFSSWAALLSDHSGYFYGGEWNVNGESTVVDEYSTTFVRRMSLQFLKEWDEKGDQKPWFMVVAPTAPHTPAPTLPEYEDAPVPSFNAPREQDRSDKPTYVQERHRSRRLGRRVRRTQLRSLMPVDDMIRRVMKSLRNKNELDSTLVFYISDNGFLWGEHGLTRKGIPYTESVRVPFFMRWDGRVKPRTVDDRLALNVDIAPTILDATGVAPDPSVEMDGRSLLQPSTRERVHTEFLAGSAPAPEWAATWTPSYHYIEYFGDDGITDSREYYDLDADPDELVNLFQDGDPTNDPIDASVLSAQLKDDLDCEGDECP